MSKIVTEFNKFMKIKEVKKYIGVHSINIPNFWSVIEYGKNSYETRYSRMIRWLLDATETHGQGNFFANELIKLSHSKNKEIKNLPVVKSGHAKCEALGSNIDIFFIDEQEKITITIELKMWSSDHANNGKHQLDKYYNTVITNYPPKKGYQNYYFYITINGVAPNIVAMNRAKKEWTNISYNEISPIIAAMKKRI
ncbi:MAG: PD-(D/E)XK nuclease family protein, partial [Culicoidibacterales bacterium]